MNNDIYKIYDTIVSAILGEIGVRTANDDVIGLKNFDPENEEHMCIFHIALIVHRLNYKNVYINTGIISELKFEHKNRILRNQFKWNNRCKNVDVIEVLNKIKQMPEYKQLPFGLASIYEEYYLVNEEKRDESEKVND